MSAEPLGVPPRLGGTPHEITACFTPLEGERFFCRVPYPLVPRIFIPKDGLPPESCPQFEWVPGTTSALPQYREVKG